jgi:Chaperone of endosialidase
MNTLIFQLKKVTPLCLIVFTLVCFALSPRVQAVLPAPDGGYFKGNTAEGENALQNLTIGHNNTATGFRALFSNTAGFANTAIGAGTLFSNTAIGHNNTATGFRALFSNRTGFDNVANGVAALILNTTGQNNTASGVAALRNNTTGSFNTADGDGALQNNRTGNFNTALGFKAGVFLTTGVLNIDIGAFGVAGDANTIRIGEEKFYTRTFVAGISGSPITGTSVVVKNDGRLGTVASSQRFKEDIKPMDKASEAILALQPVTFRYKPELDPDGIPQFGLIAEQVEKVNPDLVARDADGKVNTVRYEAVNAMLLNEFLKEHQTVQELKKQVAELTASLQKVSAQLELNKPAPQTALNNQ